MKLSNHFIKIQLLNKKWLIKFFNSEEKLFRFLDRNPYDHCYYSKNAFYFSKDTKKNLNKNDKYRIIKNYTVVDIDNSNKRNIKKIIKLLKPYNILYILQTSEGSVQIKCDYSKEDEIKRLLEEKKVQFCDSTFGHNLWVIRYPNSLNKGFKTFYLKEDLTNFIGRIGVNPTKKKRIEYWSFLRQQLSSVKDRYILVFKSPIIEEKRVKYLQLRGLGDCYILRDGKDNLIHLFPKTLSKRRLDKFSKKECLIRISEKRFGKEIFENKPEFVKVIESETRGYCSKRHMDFLRGIGVKKKYPIEIGRGIFGVAHMEVKTNDI